MNLTQLAQKASKSSFYRWLLSFQLNRVVPFNRPHGFKILALSAERLEVSLPYKKRNLNHVKGLHACAMATLAEVSSGFLLLVNLNPKRYRIILERLEMNYHYQGKMEARVVFELKPQFLEQKIKQPLLDSGKISLPCQVEIYDVAKNHLATGVAHWQIKDWQKVKTQIA
jgi:acyl-coenzyme A thioesterase PaaI-like protein